MPASLIRWDPFSEFSNIHNVFDRLFDSRAVAPAARAGGVFTSATLGLDVFETDESYVVKAAVPGVDPEALQIEVEGDVLTIKGSYEQEDESTANSYVRRELRSGSFSRALRLPPTVDASKAEAEFDRGMLKLSIPKREEAKPQTIKITPRAVAPAEAGEA